jgi:hypothetical protein
MTGSKWLRAGFVVAAAVTVGVVVWLSLRGHGSTTRGVTSGTVDVSMQRLRMLTNDLGRPVYWAGPKDGVTYEFTQSAGNRIYVRYLPRGVAAGSPRGYLTVGTYLVDHAFTATGNVARRPGEVRLAVGAGAIAFYDKARPTNAYLAFPGSKYQIEVYDPSPLALRKLVTSGAIRRVGTPLRRTSPADASPVATSVTELGRLAATLGRPIYWLGRVDGSKLELTHTSDGRIYVRYLPVGVPIGSKRRFLTVATYPVERGLSVTRAASREPGAHRLSVPNGGVAFYTGARPTNIYIAFPRDPEQIEVFDPSGRLARELVTTKGVRPVP